jgi:hypothetical protein
LVGLGGSDGRVPGWVELAVELPPGEGAVGGTVDGSVLVLVDCDDFVVVGLVDGVERDVVGTIGESLESDPQAATPHSRSAAAITPAASERARVVGVTAGTFPIAAWSNRASERHRRVVTTYGVDHRYRRRRRTGRDRRGALRARAHP